MESLLHEICDIEDLKNAEKIYRHEQVMGEISQDSRFKYASFLIRSKYKDDWRHGLYLFKELYKSGDDKLDYLYFLAFVECKLEHFDEAINYCDMFLIVQPKNSQVLALKEYTKKMKHEKATLGFAILGGAGLAIALVGFTVISKIFKK